MNGIPMLINAQYLAQYVALREARRDFDHAAVHSSQSTEEKLRKVADSYQFYQPAEGRIQSEFRSRAVVAGDIAVIPVHNSIEYRSSIWSDYGFECSTLAIKNDLMRFAGDEGVRKIILDIDSPGGVYTGTPELAKEIFQLRAAKEIIALANPLSASGALWIGAACTKFYVLGSGSVGSIGALIVHSDWSQYFATDGIVHTIIRAPENKADFNSLEALKPETKEYYQQDIDRIAAEFQTAVGRFRGVSKKVVADTYGGGRMLSAQQAISAGLCDGAVDSLEAVIGRRVASTKRVRLSPRLEAARAAGLARKNG
jgi:ClpP class serine protease